MVSVMCEVHVYVCACTCARSCTSICEWNSKHRTCMCVPVPVRAPVCLFANEIPSSGLQHPSSLEEGAGKRGLECVCLSLSVTNFRIYGQQSTSTVTCIIGIPLRVTDLVVRRIIIRSSAQDAFCLSLVVAEDNTPGLFLASHCAGKGCAGPSRAWRQFRPWGWWLIQDSCLLWKLPCFEACAHDAVQDST